jgi:hypothetical protein
MQAATGDWQSTQVRSARGRSDGDAAICRGDIIDLFTPLRQAKLMKAILLLAAIQPGPPAPPPLAKPYDCSWIYHPPTGSRERLEGVYTSFIDDGGLYECSSKAACRQWIGLEKVEIDFSEAASAELNRRRIANYGVFRVVFEGRRGLLGDRPGCETNEWSLDAQRKDYVLVEKVVRIEPLKERPR